MNTSSDKTELTGTVWAGLSAILLAWFAAAYVIGAERLLPSEGPALIAPITITAVVPVAVFLAIYAVSSRVRGFVLSQDIRTLTMLQHWRVIGFAFLPLTFFGVLPGLFATITHPQVRTANGLAAQIEKQFPGYMATHAPVVGGSPEITV